MTVRRAVSDLTSYNGSIGSRLLTKVKETEEPVVLTRYGQPHVAIVPMRVLSEYETVKDAFIRTTFSTLIGLRMDAKKVGDTKGADALDYAIDVLKEKFRYTKAEEPPT